MQIVVEVLHTHTHNVPQPHTTAHTYTLCSAHVHSVFRTRTLCVPHTHINYIVNHNIVNKKNSFLKIFKRKWNQLTSHQCA